MIASGGVTFGVTFCLGLLIDPACGIMANSYHIKFFHVVKVQTELFAQTRI